MQGKVENEKSAKIEFEKRIREAKEKAMEDNKKLAEKTGNVLSQKLDEHGNLVNTLQVDYDSIPDNEVILPEEMKEKGGSVNISARKSPSFENVTEIPKMGDKDDN